MSTKEMLIDKMSSLIDQVIRSLAHKEGCNDAELNDLNYEDVLLDVQLRAFLHKEYRDAEPPPDSFAGVLSAIKLHEESKKPETDEKRAELPQRGAILNHGKSRITNLAAHLGNSLTILYGLGSRADMSRILSGSVVAAILMLALGPSLIGALKDNRVPDWQEQPNSVSVPTDNSTAQVMKAHPEVEGATASELRQTLAHVSWQNRIEAKTGEDLSVAYEPLEAPTLHPVELGIANHRNYRLYNHLGKPGPQ